MNFFKKLFTILLITSLILPFGFKVNAFENQLVAPDELEVYSPTPNQKVSGTIQISYRIYDDAQSTINQNIEIWDGASCKITNYGSIPGISAQANSGNNSINWNTSVTSNTANLADGKYCIKVCGVYKDANNVNYSACNGRNITVANHNRPPIITSTPTNTYALQGTAWSYQLIANDPDGDPITYRFVYTADFLSINQSTGLISGTLPILASGVYRADYKITVAADDNFSGATTQEFILSVYKPLPPPPPVTGGGSSSSSSSSSSTPANSPSIINFKTNLDGVILKGKDNLIEWSVSDADGVKNVELSFSTDKASFKRLTISNNATGSYNWDVTNLPDGDYYLQITVTDNKGISTSKISPKFIIKNAPDVIESVPQITDIAPEKDAQISNKKPIISGKFVPSKDSTIQKDSFKITLDAIDITDKCNVTEAGFDCNLTKDLTNGLHKVSAEIKDSSKQAATSEWQFNITDSLLSSPVDGGSGINLSNNILIIIVAICLLTLILLIIPWILYSIWVRNRKENDEVTTQTTEYQPSSDFNATDYSIPNVTTNYYVPNSTDTTQPLADTNTNNTFDTNFVLPSDYKPYVPDEESSIDLTKVPEYNFSGDQINNYTVPESNSANTTNTSDTSSTDFVEPQATDENK